MLIKVRKLGPTFSNPPVFKQGELLVMRADMIGELVRVPESLREPAELMVGELSMTFYPVGIEVAIADGGELNGLWVQKAIYEAVKKQEAAAA